VRIDVPAAVEHLQTLLQVLEYTSVLAEFGANAFASKFGKWILIGCFQVAKAVIKLLLLLKFKQGLQLTNPVLPLDRRVDLISMYNKKSESSSRSSDAQEANSAEPQANGSEAGDGDSVVTLKRSGRVMRTLDQAPARDQRTWLLPNGDTRFKQLLQRTRKDAPPSPLTEHQTVAEVLHILKPVAHLGSMAVFGSMAWTPFFVSLGMDLASLKLLHEPHDKMWNMNESIELGQRSFALLLYVLRSPLYDRYTKEKILRILSTLSNRIPILGRLMISPMVSYLPEWQKTYFYVWGS
jgi:peroxin-16